MNFISGDNKLTTISKFFGINRREVTQTGEMLEAINVSSDEFPCLKSVKAAKKLVMTDTDGNTINNIRAAIVPNGEYDGTFTGVAGTTFYYKNKAIPFFTDAKIPETGSISLFEINGNIIISCYNNFDDRCLLFFNYNGYAKHSERTSIGYVVRCDCARFVSDSDNAFKTLPAAADNRTETTYRFFGDATLCFNNFKVGDNIVIDNLLSKYNKNHNMNTYEFARETVIRKSRFQGTGDNDEVVCVVTAVDVRKNGELSSMDYVAYNAKGEVVCPKGYTPFNFDDGYRITHPGHRGAVIRKAMPIMNSVCIQNNRLWGVNPNGEYIYSSKLGDFREFNQFDGLSSDSYYVGIGSGGGFVGIVPYKNYVIAFKKDCAYIISGTLPTNFTISRTIEGIGCIDIKSCSICDGFLYFLAQDGFYRFNGVSFELVSQKLNHKYLSATSFGTNKKYYTYATRSDGKEELLVFDATKELWHSLSTQEPVLGFFSNHDEVYKVCGNAIYLLEGEANNGWSVESTEFFNDGGMNSFVNELWIRAKIANNKWIRVFTSTDGDKYVEHPRCKGSGKMQVYRIPVRWSNVKSYKIKLEGTGDSVIYGVELHNADGSRPYKKT